MTRQAMRRRLTGILAVIMIVAVMMPLVCVMPVQAAAGIKIDSSNFPDDKFRKVISGSNYDRDSNGYLSSSEISLILNIYCDGKGIKSLKGIEYFTALQGLWCKDNRISSMDVSKNTDLRGVWCSGNKFTSLDFSKNTELVWVYCYDCKLTSLSFRKNPKLAYLECNTNPLTKLDITQNHELEHLMCGSCKLTSLDLSGNPGLQHLDAFSNKLTSLDVTGCPKLKRLDIWDNEGLGSINVSKNKGLQYYNCANNGVTSINVKNNPELQKLICSYNGNLKSLDLSCNPELVYLDCACDGISSLDLSNNPRLYFLQAFTNPFTTLDIGNNPRLVSTYETGECTAEYEVCNGHSWSVDYGYGLLYFLCFDDGVTLLTEPSGSSSDKDDCYIDTNDGLSDDADLVTREAVAMKLYELAGKPKVSGQRSGYKDVAAGAAYESAVIWCEKKHICLGWPNTYSDNFGVGELITRQDLAFMLHRYSEAMNLYSSFDYGRTDEFKDFYDIDNYAWDAFTWAIQWEILTPKGKQGAPNSQLMLYPHGRVTAADLDAAVKGMKELNGAPPGQPAQQPSKEGWQKTSGGKWKYYENGTALVSSWLKLGKTWYYFDKKGVMATGIKKIDGKIYLFKDSGALGTGWHKNSDGTYYYFTADGAVTGWKQISKVWYFFDRDSALMATGVRKIDGSIYLFSSGGAMQKSGWKQYGADWYYLNKSGSAYVNKWLKSGKKWYYFGDDGVMLKNTSRVIDGVKYSFDQSGAMK